VRGIQSHCSRGVLIVFETKVLIQETARDGQDEEEETREVKRDPDAVHATEDVFADTLVHESVPLVQDGSAVDVLVHVIDGIVDFLREGERERQREKERQGEAERDECVRDRVMGDCLLPSPQCASLTRVSP
jgi:hypothetical protein